MDLKYEDVVMADRGFNISETVGTYGAQLAIPAFPRGQKQLKPQEIIKTRLPMFEYMSNV